jgi:uncharacterized protein (DUF2252 family)
VEGETASGLIGELFVELGKRKRADFLNRRTVLKDGQRQIRIDGIKALAANTEERKAVISFMKGFAAEQPKPGFFKVLDVARRIAGTGSLGVMRYVILVEGKGSPDDNYLLDLKASQSSALLPRLKQLGIVQPAWRDEASRIATVQKRLQAVDHAFLYPVNFDNQPCVLRDLQPSEDRVAIGDWGKKLDRLREVVCTMGSIAAWDQLRASGRSGAASADELVDFAQGKNWMPELLAIAESMTKTTQAQWEAFRHSSLAAT